MHPCPQAAVHMGDIGKAQGFELCQSPGAAPAGMAMDQIRRGTVQGFDPAREKLALAIKVDRALDIEHFELFAGAQIQHHGFRTGLQQIMGLLRIFVANGHNRPTYRAYMRTLKRLLVIVPLAGRICSNP